MRPIISGEKRPQVIVDVIRQLINGRGNNGFQGTLEASATQTVFTFNQVAPGDAVILCPQTANAAAELASGQCYAVATMNTITINHRNNSQTDRTFAIVFQEAS